MCQLWSATQHSLYQAANVALFIAYSVPDTKKGVLVKHATLIVGFVCYSLWSWADLCSTVMTTWNAVIALINLVRLLHAVYHNYPRRFQREIEDVYGLLFRVHKVARTQFGRLLAPEVCNSISMATGDVYASAGNTPADRLALLTVGECEVSRGQRPLHRVTGGQFLDSPEFVANNKSHKESTVQVNIHAVTPCRLLVWQRTDLEYLLAKDASLAHIFGNIISRDIAHKLQLIAESGARKDPNSVPDLRLLALKFSENYSFAKST